MAELSRMKRDHPNTTGDRETGSIEWNGPANWTKSYLH